MARSRAIYALSRKRKSLPQGEGGGRCPTPTVDTTIGISNAYR
jgi:hypothetical protein